MARWPTAWAWAGYGPDEPGPDGPRPPAGWGGDMRRLAVTFIHGVEVTDPDYARRASDLLAEEFEAATGVPADDALTIVPVFWSGAIEDYPERLVTHTLTDGPSPLPRRVAELVSKVNAGSESALLALLALAPTRYAPGTGPLRYPTLRWLVLNLLGDAVAYQVTPSGRELYGAIHATVATALTELAERAGPDAPLAVIGHSLGSVIASNYLYDLEVERGDRAILRAPVRRLVGPTPLERGATLAFLDTLGSPLAVWAGRHTDFGVPVTVPAPELTRHHPGCPGAWHNVVDPDDVIAYPLERLSLAYADVVTDVFTRVGPWWATWNPLCHLWYWNDRRVMRPIARRLADAWRLVNR